MGEVILPEVLAAFFPFLVSFSRLPPPSVSAVSVHFLAVGLKYRNVIYILKNLRKKLASSFCQIFFWKCALFKYFKDPTLYPGLFFLHGGGQLGSQGLGSTTATSTATVVRTVKTVVFKRATVDWLPYLIFEDRENGFNTATTILVSVLKSILKIDFISPRVHVVLSTWNCLRWRCLQNEDVVD